MYVANDDGTNGEFVKVKSLTSTTFDANFASAKAANWTLLGQAKPTSSFYDSKTFTPTIAGTSTAGTGTYTAQEGRYTQIGNRVFFDLNIAWSAHTGTGNMIVSGLPIPCYLNAVKAACASSYNTLAVGSGLNLAALVDNGTTNILLYAADPAGGSIAALAMDTAGSIRLSGSYEV